MSKIKFNISQVKTNMDIENSLEIHELHWLDLSHQVYSTRSLMYKKNINSCIYLKVREGNTEEIRVRQETKVFLLGTYWKASFNRKTISNY